MSPPLILVFFSNYLGIEMIVCDIQKDAYDQSGKWATSKAHCREK